LQNRHFFIFLFGLIFSFPLSAQDFSLFLIGDTGKDSIPSEVLYLMEFETNNYKNSAVVFLGDNVYPRGIHPNANPQSTAVRTLINQLDLFNEYQGQLYITPGNHDWANGKRNGANYIKAQEKNIEEWRAKNKSLKNEKNLFPSDVLPGPSSIVPKKGIRLVFINSQWFLQKNVPKKKRKTIAKSFERLDSIINLAKKQNETIVILAHHPIYSNGKHASAKQPFRFLIQYTPFQIFGLMGLNRYFRQDLRNIQYRRYIDGITDVMDKYENLIYISGHEHNLQHFHIDNNHFIISGSGSKLDRLSHYYHQARLMEDQQMGYIRLIFHEDGNVSLAAHGTKSRGEFARYRLTNVSIENSLPDSTKPAQ